MPFSYKKCRSYMFKVLVYKVISVVWSNRICDYIVMIKQFTQNTFNTHMNFLFIKEMTKKINSVFGVVVLRAIEYYITQQLKTLEEITIKCKLINRCHPERDWVKYYSEVKNFIHKLIKLIKKV